MALQRQGRIGFYGEARGPGGRGRRQRPPRSSPQDWLVPALREAGAGVYRGHVAELVRGADLRQRADDVEPGRQLPCHPCDRDQPLRGHVDRASASQIPHAVGIAMGDEAVAATPARCASATWATAPPARPTSTSRMNFAGVIHAPVVLVCQNNQWAISTPGTRADRVAETIASRASATASSRCASTATTCSRSTLATPLRRGQGARAATAPPSSSC